MTVTSSNIFDRIPANLPDELVERIAGGGNVTIERIVSRGQASAEGFWYDQNRDEFVILLAGAAGLLFEGDESVVVLKPGDYLDIPAHQKHRVAWTSPDEETVWLAVHY